MSLWLKTCDTLITGKHLNNMHTLTPDGVPKTLHKLAHLEV